MLPQVVASPQFRAGDQHDSFPNLHFRSGAQLYVPGARLFRAVFDNSRPRARIFALVRGLSRLVPHGIHVVRAFRPLGTCRNRVPTNDFQVVGCTNRSASCTNCAPTCTNCPTTCTNYRTPCTNYRTPCANDLTTCTHRLTTCTNLATANSPSPAHRRKSPHAQAAETGFLLFLWPNDREVTFATPRFNPFHQTHGSRRS